MTRLVTLFFAAIALLLTAYWVVPGAKPPEMAAVAPPPALSTAPIVPQALVRRETAPAAPAATASATLPAADPAPQRPVRTADVGCDGDPIKCMLDGRNHRPDPLETTGSIVPKKPAQKAAPKPLPRPQP